MIVSAIVAAAQNNVIGDGNDIPWRISSDLKYFKRTTLDHHVIMGRKTFESLGKPLPNRTTIIITRNTEYKVEGCVVVHDLLTAIEAAREDKNPFILGGAEIYKQAMPLADVLDLTLVHDSFDADAFFPDIDGSVWKEVNREDHLADEKNTYDYSFVQYKKK